ncbi:MAG: Amuc_1102 family pilus-like protein [Verrucomicrobiota bacterium]
MKSSILVLATLALGLSGLQAQAPAVKVDINKPKLNPIQTPQFSAGNVPDKNWRPKTWLEVDMEFDVKVPTSAGGRNGSVATMTVHYYLAMNATAPDGKRHVLKGTLTYSDIPAAEKCHALAFASPATLRRVLAKDNFTGADVAGWGVEVVIDGTVVKADSSAGGAWWEAADKYLISEGALLAKGDTPFGILWGDYDVQGKSK